MDEYITLDEAAKICNVTRAAIYRWQKNGRITLYKKGSRTVVKRSDIEEIKRKTEEIRPFN
ncbi:MAG: helix-turn-helix domain-containing protein [Firmicutes bacterium]|nr:helix-turn-helix domain-containing protein [Bacillota bacterium]